MARYVLLPRGGVTVDPQTGPLLRQLHSQANVTGFLSSSVTLPVLPNHPFHLVDSVYEAGPKLTEMNSETADAINLGTGPLRALPEVIYPHPKPPFPILPAGSVPAAGAGSPILIHCEDASTGAPLQAMTVIAFDNFAARTGDSGRTDAAGDVALNLSAPVIDRLYVLPTDAYWGAFRQTLAISTRIVIPITSLTPNFSDSIRTTYSKLRFNALTGVRVGILDTGSGPHTDLNIVFGRCTVTGAPAANYQDIDEHGTHVAGIVGGRGGIGLVTRGVAPGVDLYVFRVFDYSGGVLGASNYAILKAMILAGTQKCDIINLSLGGGPYDAIVAESIDDARNQGMLVAVAAGNDDRGAVTYPAAYPGATAISAMGIYGTFPAGCYFEADVQRPPYGTVSALEFLASFSNVGAQVACTGLGSAVLSTYPSNRFGPMSGTSMATPMVAGAAASLLSNNPVIFAMPRDRARSNAIERLLQTNCKQHFGGGIWEGYGLPDPASV